MNIKPILDEMREASKTGGVQLKICKLAKNSHAADHWDHDGPEVWLEWVESDVKGAGAMALRKLLAVADRHNVMLRALLDDDGRGKLEAYYAQFGFKRDPAGGHILERAPVGRPEPEAHVERERMRV